VEINGQKVPAAIVAQRKQSLGGQSGKSAGIPGIAFYCDDDSALTSLIDIPIASIMIGIST
jgi:hypothetical protein